MKKFAVAAFVLALLCLCACGAQEEAATTAATVTTTVAPTETTVPPTTEAACAHEYAVVETAATCSAEGAKVYTCTLCGETYTETIAALEHTFTEATCTAPKTCSVCKATEGNAKGHTVKNPSCTEKGKCETCGATTDPAPHKFSDPSCTEARTCERCSAKIEPTGHSFADATCKAPKTCKVCKVTEGEPLPHTFTDATCTAPKTCSVCKVTEGAALGHSYSEATCTTPKTCATCGATSGRSLGHNYAAATCTEAKKCTRCGATSGSALGHKYVNGTCSRCGGVETIVHPIETGTGYAVTVSGNFVTCYSVSTSELLYDHCTKEKPATGWYKFREYKGNTYYSPSPSWGWIAFNSYSINGRTVKMNVDGAALELELISANQYKVTKGMDNVPAGTVFTFGTDMCSFAGHLYERSCVNDVTCMYCDHVKSAGLGHEYGQDDICFRCFAATRPSDTKPITQGTWRFDALLATESTELDRFTMRFNDGGEASFGAGFYHLYDEEYDKEYVEGGGETFTFGGKLYVSSGFGSAASGSSYTENGDVVTITVQRGETGTITFKRTGENTLTITGISGIILDESLTATLHLGAVFRR